MLQTELSAVTEGSVTYVSAEMEVETTGHQLMTSTSQKKYLSSDISAQNSENYMCKKGTWSATGSNTTNWMMDPTIKLNLVRHRKQHHKLDDGPHNKVNGDMFADDTSLNTSDKDKDTVQKELQRSINEASDWCDNNAMILHPAKTKGMSPATRHKHQLRPFHLNLKDTHTEQVHEHRHLGVITDDEFSWRPHITGTCKTVSKNLYLFSQLRQFVDTSKRKLFFHAHISPHSTYASTVCDGCSDILFNKLNSLHRIAAKLISDSSLTTDTKLRYLGLLPVKEKLMFNKAVLVFKAYTNLAPPYLKQLFICSNTRATSRFITLSKPRIDLSFLN